MHKLTDVSDGAFKQNIQQRSRQRSRQNKLQADQRLGGFFRGQGGKEGLPTMPLYGPLLGVCLLMGSCSLPINDSNANPPSPLDAQNNAQSNARNNAQNNAQSNAQSNVNTQLDGPSEPVPSELETEAPTGQTSQSTQDLASGAIAGTAGSPNRSVGSHQGGPSDDSLRSVLGSEGATKSALGDRPSHSPQENAEVVVIEDNAVALNKMVSQLDTICDNQTQATYESQRLHFADNNTTAYVQGQFQKDVSPSALPKSDTLDACDLQQRVTPEHSMVIQREGSSLLMDMESVDEGYVMTTPLSYSADGRYLIASVEVAYIGGDPGAYSIIFDLDRREKLELESYICKGADFDEYLGFTQPSEVAFRCSYYGEVDEWTEILDLETRSISKTSIAAETLKDYGAIVQPFQYAIDP